MGLPNIKLLLWLCLMSSSPRKKKVQHVSCLIIPLNSSTSRKDWIYIHTYIYIYIYIHTDVHQVNLLLDWLLARIYRTLLAAGAEDIQLTEVPGKVDMAEG